MARNAVPCVLQTRISIGASMGAFVPLCKTNKLSEQAVSFLAENF